MAINAPFTTQPRLTQIAMAVKPAGMIADLILPRIQVPSDKFIYSKMIPEELFTVVDTRVGRKSNPNEVEFGAIDVTDSVDDFALDDFVPQRDQDAANAGGANIDPMGTATEGVSILLDLAREQRVASLIFNLNTYDATLRATLSGTSQFSDYANSDPLGVIDAALDSMLVRANKMVMGRLAWSKFRSHPKVVAAVLNKQGGLGGVTASGKATREGVADYFEIDEVIVGESYVNNSKKGQTAAFARLWGKHIALLRIDSNVRNVQGFAFPTFGFTAQWNNKFAGTIQDSSRGIRGGTTVRVGEQIKELVCFQQAGYFIQNAVA